SATVKSSAALDSGVSGATLGSFFRRAIGTFAVVSPLLPASARPESSGPSAEPEELLELELELLLKPSSFAGAGSPGNACGCPGFWAVGGSGSPGNGCGSPGFCACAGAEGAGAFGSGGNTRSGPQSAGFVGTAELSPGNGFSSAALFAALAGAQFCAGASFVAATQGVAGFLSCGAVCAHAPIASVITTASPLAVLNPRRLITSIRRQHTYLG